MIYSVGIGFSAPDFGLGNEDMNGRTNRAFVRVRHMVALGEMALRLSSFLACFVCVLGTLFGYWIYTMWMIIIMRGLELWDYALILTPFVLV